VKFFFDNNLAPPLARAMHELSKPQGHTVAHLREFYSDGKASDAEWIELIASESGWAIVTIDNILRDAAAYQALKSSGLTFFFLAGGWGHLDRWSVVHKLVLRWPSILKAVDAISPGQAYRVKITSPKLEPFRI
jgi:hypothetical protein